jgi:hypothetical protein
VLSDMVDDDDFDCLRAIARRMIDLKAPVSILPLFDSFRVLGLLGVLAPNGIDPGGGFHQDH